MRVILSTDKKKTVTVKPGDLIAQGLLEFLSDKLNTTVSESDIVSFDGKKAVVNTGDTVEYDIDDDELLHMSAEKILQKRLNKRGKLNLQVSRAGKPKK